MERLGDVVVGTELQPHHPVDGVALARHHDDGDLGSRADLAADRETVAIGQVEVERHQIERTGGQKLHRLRAGAGLGHPIALALKAAAQQQTHLGIVLDDQNVTGGLLDHRDPCCGGG